jgi:hypothetical protein
VVESQPSKLLVAGSIPVSRSSLRFRDERELRLAGLASVDMTGCELRLNLARWLNVRVSGKVGRRVPAHLRAVAVAERGSLWPHLSAVARSAKADVAQLAERVLGKDEVTGSIPVIGSSLRSLPSFGCVGLTREFG